MREKKTFGSFQLQLLEGPTDNPIRLSARASHADLFYVFGVGSPGWEILAKVWRTSRSSIEVGDNLDWDVTCLANLAKRHAKELGVIESS